MYVCMYDLHKNHPVKMSWFSNVKKMTGKFGYRTNLTKFMNQNDQVYLVYAIVFLG